MVICIIAPIWATEYYEFTGFPALKVMKKIIHCLGILYGILSYLTIDSLSITNIEMMKSNWIDVELWVPCCENHDVH